ncbi:MAG: ribosome biogenesis GTPase Der [Thermodesulfobacteriota bacterium]|nr:ribosome biogenesis GTPase Der [Thermodesulfobacteriota bacterium]
MPVVAIVGRPNVGKSTLFNALVRDKRAIVGAQRGITRDSIYALWHLDDDLDVDLVDTGGFDTLLDSEISHAMRKSTMRAIQDSDFLLCVFDAASGITPDDAELVSVLRQTNAAVIYVANKVDDPNGALGASMLYDMGIGEFVEVSALNRSGLKEIENRLRQRFSGPDIAAALRDDTALTRVVIMGRPNVGKSMLLNRITGKQRSIVSAEAGTTRDCVDIQFTHNGHEYLFVDTAGMRRRTHIQDEIEHLSVGHSIRSAQRAHVCLVLIDPLEGITDQDRRLVSIIINHGRAPLMVINKTDLIDAAQKDRVGSDISYLMRYMPDLETIFVSALTGHNVNRIFGMIDKLFEKVTMKVPTPRINRILQEIVERNPPPVIRGKRPKFLYVTQTKSIPPTFRIVSSRPKAISHQYSKYLSGAIKKTCGLEGVPVSLYFVKR